MNPTIIPGPCGRELSHPSERVKFHCGPLGSGATWVCSRCTPLGERYAEALHGDSQHWSGVLAFNLSIAALLYSAVEAASVVVIKGGSVSPEDLAKLHAGRSIDRLIVLDSEPAAGRLP